MDVRWVVFATALSIAACGAGETAAPTGGMGGAGGAGAGGMNAGAGGMSGGASGASGASATGGGSGASSAIPPTFETVKLVLGGGGAIMPCAAAPCHGLGGVAPPAMPLALPSTDDALLYANLTTYVSQACGSAKLVEPGNPAQSALLMILTGPCGMTPRMPYGCEPESGSCIPDEYVAALTQWIASGAPGP